MQVFAIYYNCSTHTAHTHTSHKYMVTQHLINFHLQNTHPTTHKADEFKQQNQQIYHTTQRRRYINNLSFHYKFSAQNQQKIN